MNSSQEGLLQDFQDRIEDGSDPENTRASILKALRYILITKNSMDSVRGKLIQDVLDNRLGEVKDIS